MLYQWVVFLHVLGVVLFVLAHGVSAIVIFRLKQGTSRERIAALAELSGASIGLMSVGLLLMALTGIWAAFIGQLWGQRWIWASVVVFIFVTGAMTPMAANKLTAVRKAAGVGYMQGSKRMPAEKPASDAEIRAAVEALKPWPIAIVGYGGLAALIWLMMFKPLLGG